MATSDVKGKDAKAVAYSTDEHGNIVIDINTKVVLSEKMAEAYNINLKKPTTQEERHAAEKLNKDFASKAGSARENTASKKETDEKGMATASKLNQDLASTPESAKVTTSSKKGVA